MKKSLIIIVLLALAYVAYYAISPIFDVQEVNDDIELSTINEVEKFTSEIRSTAGHPATGTVRIYDTDAGKIIRFEEFETINGPNLHLYLSKDLEANEFIDIGPIRGTKGNINYEIPDDIDLSEYKYVLHWCVPFGVLFNYAELEYGDI